MTGGLSVAVVVVHWANVEDTIECLESLRAVDYPHLGVVLVDNGSRDLDPARARRSLPGVRVIAAGRNLGFAGGNNLGIARALADGADLILLLNNDTVVRPDLIRRLLPALDEPDVGIVGPVITYYDAPDRVWFGGGVYSRFLGYSYRARPLAPFAGRRTVDFINGCALLAKREVFERAGLLWDDLFLYFEEVEFCRRVAGAGYRCVLVGDPLVRHKVSASAGRRGSDHLTPDKAYYFGRNPFLLLRRGTARPWAATAILSQFVVVLPYWIRQCIRARNARPLTSYLTGMRDGLLGRGGPRPAR